MKKHIQRRFFLPVLSAAVIFAVLSCTAPADKSAENGGSESSLQTILKRGTIRVGTTGDFNPMSF